MEFIFFILLCLLPIIVFFHSIKKNYTNKCGKKYFCCDNCVLGCDGSCCENCPNKNKECVCGYEECICWYCNCN